MAARSGPSMKHAGYRLFSPAPTTESLPSPLPAAADEFDESDVWGTGDPWAGEPKKPVRVSGRPNSSSGKFTATGGGDTRGRGGSVPMNIPDWSKILRDEYKSSSKKNAGVWEEEEEEEEEEYGTVIPPHELLWRSRASSLSVQEGMGRTLKGRDLSRVRNAIWAKTGFQD